MAEFLLLLLGIVSMLYFAGIALYAGFSSKFPVLYFAGSGILVNWGGSAFHIQV